MFSKIFFFTSVVLFLASCGNQGTEKMQQEITVKVDTTKPAPEVKEKESDDRFFATPDTLTAENEITVNLPKSHPAKLAVISPRNEYYYIQDLPDIHLMGDSATFKNLTRFKLQKGRQGGVFRDGAYSETEIFTKPGKYKILLSDNFDTEPENTTSMETAIFFIPK